MVFEDDYFPLVLTLTFVFSLVNFLLLLRPPKHAEDLDLADGWDAKVSKSFPADAPERPRRPLPGTEKVRCDVTKTESCSSTARMRPKSDSSGTDCATKSPGPVAVGRGSVGNQRRQCCCSAASESLSILQEARSSSSFCSDGAHESEMTITPHSKVSDNKRTSRVQSETLLALSPQSRRTTPQSTWATSKRTGRQPGDSETQIQDPQTLVSHFSSYTPRKCMPPSKPSAPTTSLVRVDSSSGSRFYSHVVLQNLKRNAQQLSGCPKEGRAFRTELAKLL